MKLVILICTIFCFGKLNCRSANDFLKDVFSLDEEPQIEKCSTMECQTAGNNIL